MSFEIEMLVFAFFCFLWLACAFEAFNSLSGGRVRRLESRNPALAKKLERWLESEDSFRGLFKTLLFLMLAMMACFSLSLAVELFPKEPLLHLAILCSLACLLLAAGSEVLVRLVLFRFDLHVLRATMPVLGMLSSTLFLPLTVLMKTLRRKTGNWGQEAGPAADKATAEDEILSFVESYGEDTDLEESEKRMIRGIFDLDDMSVREIMTPRVDLVAIPSSASVKEAKETFVKSGHSRIPIYGRSVDEIKGIIFAKDFLAESVSGKTLDQLAHKPIFIPETKAVGALLDEIKRSRNHFAVIIDEYGGTSGIVTFEDIIEEIVGEVHDEYDTEEDIKSKPQLMPDGSIVLDARTLIGDVNEILESEIPDNDSADTIGGFVCAELGRIPEEGEKFRIPGGIAVVVIKADKRKILQLKLSPVDEDE